jgi:zinc transporter ZupT
MIGNESRTATCRLRLAAGLFAGACLSVGLVVVTVIAIKSGFGTRFGKITTEVMRIGIFSSLIGAMFWWLLSRRRRALRWLCGLGLLLAGAIIASHHFQIACTSKKINLCEPLNPFAKSPF